MQEQTISQYSETSIKRTDSGPSLMEGVRLMKVCENCKTFLYTVIKLQVVNQAILNSSSLPTLMLFVCMDLSLFN